MLYMLRYGTKIAAAADTHWSHSRHSRHSSFFTTIHHCFFTIRVYGMRSKGWQQCAAVLSRRRRRTSDLPAGSTQHENLRIYLPRHQFQSSLLGSSWQL